MTADARKQAAKGAVRKPIPKTQSKTANGAARPSASENGAEAIQVVLERSNFFESGIKMMKRLAMGLGALALVSVGLTCAAVNQKTSPVYFVAYEDGRLVEMVPLSQPNHSQTAVSQWLVTALTETFDFHFGNIDKRLNDAAARWFTTSGADALMQTWDDSGNYKAIVDRKLFLSLAVKHTPVLLKQGVPPGTSFYVWRFQVPAVLTFRSGTQEFTNSVLFTVDVSRRSILEDPKGLGITKIVMRIEK